MGSKVTWQASCIIQSPQEKLIGTGTITYLENGDVLISVDAGELDPGLYGVVLADDGTIAAIKRGSNEERINLGR